MGCMESSPAKVNLTREMRYEGPQWQLETYDTDEVLGKAFYFFECQEAGKLRKGHRVKWRGDSYLHDGRKEKLDLSGGWHDAGDHLKLMFPMCWAITNVAWALVEGGGQLRQGRYDGQRNEHWALQTLLHGVDYLLKCHIRPDAFVIQIGEVDPDHSSCIRAERDTRTPRTLYVIDRQKPGADAFAQAAAAFAAACVALREHAEHAKLAEQCLQHAQAMLKVAAEMKCCYCDSEPVCAKTYKAEHWQQFMFFAAAWLYKATGDSGYREEAHRWRKEVEERRWWSDYSWMSTYFGAVALLWSIDQDKEMGEQLDYFAKSHMNSENGIKRTPCGLTFVTEWGSCRHAAGAAAIMAIYARHLHKQDSSRAAQVLHFARTQMCHMLGGCGHSFVIGFGKKPPRCPHHRDSALRMEQSGDWEAFNNGRGANPNELTGGLCGGPLADGSWKDDRADYKANEVALDYNAAFVVGLTQCLASTAEMPPPTSA